MKTQDSEIVKSTKKVRDFFLGEKTIPVDVLVTDKSMIYPATNICAVEGYVNYSEETQLFCQEPEQVRELVSFADLENKDLKKKVLRNGIEYWSRKENFNETNELHAKNIKRMENLLQDI